MAAPAGEHDRVQGTVQAPVAAAVEPVTDDLARARRDRGRPGQAGEGRLRAQPARVRPGADQEAGRDRPDAGQREQARAERAHERLELALELARLGVGLQDPLGAGAQGEHAGARVRPAAAAQA
jgi:hypothetical protein